MRPARSPEHGRRTPASRLRTAAPATDVAGARCCSRSVRCSVAARGSSTDALARRTHALGGQALRHAPRSRGARCPASRRGRALGPTALAERRMPTPIGARALAIALGRAVRATSRPPCVPDVALLGIQPDARGRLVSLDRRGARLQGAAHLPGAARSRARPGGRVLTRHEMRQGDRNRPVAFTLQAAQWTTRRSDVHCAGSRRREASAAGRRGIAGVRARRGSARRTRAVALFAAHDRRVDAPARGEVASLRTRLTCSGARARTCRRRAPRRQLATFYAFFPPAESLPDWVGRVHHRRSAQRPAARLRRLPARAAQGPAPRALPDHAAGARHATRRSAASWPRCWRRCRPPRSRRSS